MNACCMICIIGGRCDDGGMAVVLSGSKIHVFLSTELTHQSTYYLETSLLVNLPQ